MRKHNSIYPALILLGLIVSALAGLKLAGAIHWSWVWVLAPMWIPIVAVAVIIAIAIVAVIVREISKQVEASMTANREIDREAAALGVQRSKGESDHSFAKRVQRVKELTGR